MTPSEIPRSLLGLISDLCVHVHVCVPDHLCTYAVRMYMIERRVGNNGAAKASGLLLFYMDTPGEIVHLLSHSLVFLPTGSLTPERSVK